MPDWHDAAKYPMLLDWDCVRDLRVHGNVPFASDMVMYCMGHRAPSYCDTWDVRLDHNQMGLDSYMMDAGNIAMLVVVVDLVFPLLAFGLLVSL